MAYIGRGLDRGNYLKLDDISSQFDGSLTTFNLTAGGQPFYPGSAFALLVSISIIIFFFSKNTANGRIVIKPTQKRAELKVRGPILSIPVS